MSRSFGAFSLTTSPPIRSSPSEMSSRPAIIRSAVDFPQPDGPTRIMNSPSSMFRSMDLTASKPSGWRVVRPSGWMSAIIEVPLLPLDRAAREARDDPALEEQDEQDDRDGHEDRGRRDVAGGRGELRLAGEERQRLRDR